MIRKQLQIVFVFFLVIFSINFYDTTLIPKRILNYTTFLYTIGLIVVSAPHFFVIKKGFALPVQLITISILISIPMAYLSWGQSLMFTFMETYKYIVWFAFFYLIRHKIPIRTIESITVFYGILYIVLYFFQLSQAPKVLFGIPPYGDEFSMDRGIIRIQFPGAGVFILTVFIAINKITEKAKGKWLWLMLSVFGILIPVLQVTRQFIAGMVLLFYYHFNKKIDILKQLVVLVLCALALFVVINADIPVINGLAEAQERDTKLGDDYIRIKAGNYFLTDFSPNFLAKIMGNGAPGWGDTAYGVFIENLAETKEYFLSDVGIIAMYSMFGILTIIGYLIIWIKSFIVPIPKEYHYLRYYLWYLLFTCFTSSAVYRYDYLISTVFVLYIYQVIIESTYNVEIEGKGVGKFYIPAEAMIGSHRQ